MRVSAKSWAALAATVSALALSGCAGVLPAATMSVINGVVMRPSGRTWT